MRDGFGNCRRLPTEGAKVSTLKNLVFFEDRHSFIEDVHIYSKDAKNMYMDTFMAAFGVMP
jgi:hypothetical protein